MTIGSILWVLLVFLFGCSVATTIAYSADIKHPVTFGLVYGLILVFMTSKCLILFFEFIRPYLEMRVI
jgi:hypothetical protein